MPSLQTNQQLPSIFVKNVGIRVHDRYEFRNAPFSVDDDKPDEKMFIGRKKLKEKMMEFLTRGGNKGVYLVTGYRGMGKTSFVQTTLKEYRKNVVEKGEQLEVISIPLAQNNLTEENILINIVNNLYQSAQKIHKEHIAKYNLWEKAFIKYIAILAVPSVLFILNLVFPKQTASVIKSALGKTIPLDGQYGVHFITAVGSWLFLTLLVIVTAYIIRKKTVKREPGSYTMIEDLYRRCYSSLVRESENKSEISFEPWSAKFTGPMERQVFNYPIANSKEIEHGLQLYLKKETEEKRHYVFVFDELDKIEPPALTTTYYEDLKSFESNKDENNYLQQLRRRKQTIINIIASLKSFLTTGNARFFFIAGREMFDASLADIADREDSISSIFTYIFYVESFLKESGSGKNNTSLSQSIEQYLNLVIFDDEEPGKAGIDKKEPGNAGIDVINKEKEPNSTVSEASHADDKPGSDKNEPNFYKRLKARLDKTSLPDDEKSKVIIMMQNYVTYLTYRSNGSPKKLIRAVHEFIRIDNRSFIDNKGEKLIFFDPVEEQPLPVAEEKQESTFKQYVEKIKKTIAKSEKITKAFEQVKKWAARHKPPVPEPAPATVRYLYFNFNDQYRIGFINYLYRPFLIKYGKSFKSYSDSIISSTPYLFDHLIKFHPFAFSIKNLELIPEVLSTSKTPSLREHLERIVSYLYNGHIRETEISLFNYKFYSRILNEITYLSKIFEEESAAFNFTLDESYLVKLHVRSKIKELRSIYARFQKGSRDNRQIFSLFYLNTVLGDLHFFDQEYDDAIVAYSDAIKPFAGSDIESLNFLDFISVFNCRLKLGLVFEKLKSYQDALPFYTIACQDAILYVESHLAQPAERPGTRDSSPNGVDWPDGGSFQKLYLSEILQIAVQAFIAKIVLLEKWAAGGVSPKKMIDLMASFLKLMKNVEKSQGKNHLITANLFLVTGNLLFYKNANFVIDNSIDDSITLKKAEKNKAAEKTNLSEQAKENEKDEKINELDEAINFYLAGFNRVFEPELQLQAGKTNTISKNLGTDVYIRKPTFALSMYMVALDEILRSRRFDPALTFHRIISRFETSSERVIRFMSTKVILEGPQFTKNHYRNIGILLSNIGNCWLSIINVKENAGTYNHKVNVKYFFDAERYKAEQRRINPGKIPGENGKPDENNKSVKNIPFMLTSSFLSCIISSSTQLKKAGAAHADHPINIGHILKCYYLSALYFFKVGRSSTSCYQLKKILYVLRIILKDDPQMKKNPEDANSRESPEEVFVSFLYDEVIEQIRIINSKVAEYSDNHMTNKLKATLELHTEKDDTGKETVQQKEAEESMDYYIRNNLSNHPEKREADLLYYYIQLKLLKDHYIPDNIISGSNSIASQFIRLVELDLYQKMNFLQTKEIDAGKERDEYICKAGNYIYALVSIISILNIYGVSYTISFNYLAYSHYRIARFLQAISDKTIKKEIVKRVTNITGATSSYVIDDIEYHYRMAKDNYEKAIQLHTVGHEYKKAMDDLIYLEDDINDNAYHFGAAMERYLFTNEVLTETIAKCDEGLYRIK